MRRLILTCTTRDCSHYNTSRELLLEDNEPTPTSDDERMVCLECHENYQVENG